MTTEKIILKYEQGDLRVIGIGYREIIVMTDHSFRYEKKWLFGPEPKETLKWSYKTQSKYFKNTFNQLIVSLQDRIDEHNGSCCDGALFAIDIITEDGNYHISDFIRESYFENEFRIIKTMIPQCEILPSFLSDE